MLLTSLDAAAAWRWGVCLVLAFCSVMSAGCTSQGNAVAPSPDAAYKSFMDQAVARAGDQGADREQVAILEEARAAGEVTVSHLYRAAALAQSCFDELGVDGKFIPASSVDAGAGLDIEVRITSDETEVLADGCVDRYFDSVSYAYGLQPLSVAESDARLLEAREAIVECARQHDVELADNASADELRRALYFLDTGMELGGAAAQPPPGHEPVDCAGPAGIPGY